MNTDMNTKLGLVFISVMLIMNINLSTSQSMLEELNKSDLEVFNSLGEILSQSHAVLPIGNNAYKIPVKVNISI
jgi:hypothetical protein